jgi:hypothetical protein
MRREERPHGFEPVSPELVLVDPELVAQFRPDPKLVGHAGASIIVGVLTIGAYEIRGIQAMLSDTAREVGETDQTLQRRLVHALLEDEQEIIELRERAERVQRRLSWSVDAVPPA